MQTSPDIKNLSVALVEFHKAIGKISKDAINPFFNKSYCSLPNILEAIMPHLNNAGLSIIQFPEGANELTTRLMHSSGEWMEAKYTMPVAKQNDPQALGSAISYQRRYSIMSVLCLTIDDDDDANRATHGSSTPKAVKQSAVPQPVAEQAPQNTTPVEKPWLNKWANKEQTKETAEWGTVLSALTAGKCTLAYVESKYKLSKELKEELKSFEKKA